MSVPWQAFASAKAIALTAQGHQLMGYHYDWNKKQWNPDKLAAEPKANAATCSKCKQEKHIDEFYKRPPQYSGGRGYSYYCKSCTKESSKNS